MPFQEESPGGLPKTTNAAATAGTTQTIAGATALTAYANKVTTGNANDGVSLPAVGDPASVGATLIICNVSANALKVYPYYTADTASIHYGGTVDGGAANAFATQAASTTYLYQCTAVNTWKSTKTS